jgi:hypothetical protein
VAKKKKSGKTDVISEHLSFLETSEGLIYTIQLIKENIADDAQEIDRLEAAKSSLNIADQDYLQALISKRDILNEQAEALKMQYKEQTGENYVG